MKIKKIIGVTCATLACAAAVSLSAAPAQADTGWGGKTGGHHHSDTGWGG